MAEEQISVKISELTETTSFNDDDELPLVQDGTTKKIKRTKVVESIKADLGSAAQAESTDFEPAGAVAEVEAQLVETSNQQNERLERLEYSIYLIQKNGVFKAYRTKALMLADVANIPANSVVSVVNDPTNNPETDDVNGEYHYNGTDFFKLPNNLLDQLNIKTATAEANAKSYADVKKAEAIQTAAFDAQIKADEVKDFAQEEINNLGISNSSLSSISVAIVDEDDNRTWLEADETGKPTSYAAQNIIEVTEPTIEQKIQTEKPLIIQEAALQATQETLDQVGIEQRALETISVAIVDEDDARTWLEADEAGKPTDYSKSLLIDALDTDITEKVAKSGVEQSSSIGISVAVVDEDDARTWLEADEAGKPTPYAAQKITEAINFDEVVIPSFIKSTYQTQSIKAVSGPDVDCDGDSMTAGAGSNGAPYSSVLQTLLTAAGSTAVVRNSGVGGESSVTITARVGGYPFQVRVTDGVIPATTTPVVITLDQINGQMVRPLLQGNGGASGFIGVLAGVKGSIALVKPNGGSTWDNANYYTFTRSVAGNEVVVNRPEPFVTDYAKARQGDIKIIWIGQNGPSEARAIQDAKAIIQSMQALDKRYIVISKPTASPSDDSLWFAEFGDRFIAAKKYLVEFGLADAGITPTEQDITDMSNYVIPLPLCSSSTDRLHWSAAGYSVLAKLIFKKLNQLGWI